MKTYFHQKNVMQLILFAFLSLPIFSHAQADNTLRHFLQTTPSPTQAIPYGNNPEAGQYVEASDADIYYEVYGKGKPVVILHGGVFGSTYEMFQFIDSLKQDYQVIAVSTRGHGKSELGTEAISFQQKAEDVLTVINAETDDSVIVLGFSDGGYTGLKLASAYPERVKKLIVIGASELSPGVRNFAFDAKKAVALDSIYWKQQFDLMPEPERLQEMLNELSSMYNSLTVGEELLGKIKSPVLIMAGDRDPSNSVQRVVNTAHMISNSQLSIIPNATHAVFLENFPAVWTSLLPFLKQ